MVMSLLVVGAVFSDVGSLLVTGIVGFVVCTGLGMSSESESRRLSYGLVVATVGVLLLGLPFCSVHPSSGFGSDMYLILNNY